MRLMSRLLDKAPASKFNHGEFRLKEFAPELGSLEFLMDRIDLATITDASIVGKSSRSRGSIGSLIGRRTGGADPERYVGSRGCDVSTARPCLPPIG
jgi:hypothetical protein